MGQISDGEPGDDLVVALLSVGEGEPAVDLEGLSALVSAVGLDESVVDALGLRFGDGQARAS